MKPDRFKHLLYLFAITPIFCFGQIQTRLVKPADTNPQYSSEDKRHAVIRNTDYRIDKLFLFLGGTGSNSEAHYEHLMEHAAGLGYDVINLNYVNTVATFSLADDPDSLAFDHYRQELCFGTPVSDAVAVDTLNSIFSRAINLLKYLDENYPAENWGKYLLAHETMNWSSIAVGGHSQGAGHAGYLGKQHSVDRVLMFSGPNDYSNAFQQAAHWIRDGGMTPLERHFAYLHLYDEIVDFTKQFVNISGLGMLAVSDTIHIDVNPPPYGNSHCLYTTQVPIFQTYYHNMTALPSAVSSVNEGVWEYLLTTATTTKVEDHSSGSRLSVFPNPASNVFYVRSSEAGMDRNYELRNTAGQLVKSGRVIATDPFSVDVSGLATGIYFLHTRKSVTRIMIR